MTAHQESVVIRVSDSQTVSGLWLRPARAWACLVFAPGAGAGMHQSFLASLAERLGLEGLATLRYQFPSVERGRARPDSAGALSCDGASCRQDGACDVP